MLATVHILQLVVCASVNSFEKCHHHIVLSFHHHLQTVAVMNVLPQKSVDQSGEGEQTVPKLLVSAELMTWPFKP